MDLKLFLVLSLFTTGTCTCPYLNFRKLLGFVILGVEPKVLRMPAEQVLY